MEDILELLFFLLIQAKNQNYERMHAIILITNATTIAITHNFNEQILDVMSCPHQRNLN